LNSSDEHRIASNRGEGGHQGRPDMMNDRGRSLKIIDDHREDQ